MPRLLEKYRGKEADLYMKIWKKDIAPLPATYDCWVCGEDSHFARDCPDFAASGAESVRSQG